MILFSLSIKKCVFSAGSVPPSSHLTFCALTKSNLYFDCFFEIIITEPTLWKLLTFHNPNLISIFRHLGRLSNESAQVWGFISFFVTNLFFTVKVCQPHAQPPSWRTTPCSLSAAAYSIYSQLAGGRSSILNLRTRHSVVTGTHLTWNSGYTQSTIYI
jgi:hypothetical protein